MIQKEKKYEILLNKMFTGKYTENNIGHEIINLYKCDNGNNYIYILPYGGIAKEHNDRIRYILLVGAEKEHRIPVLAKVEDVVQIHFGGDKGNIDTHHEQIGFIETNDVKYGGKPLHQIMLDNEGNEKALYITFQSKSVIKPLKPIYLYDESANIEEKHNEYNLKVNMQLHFHSKTYVDEQSDAGETLLKLIEDENGEYWENGNNTEKIDISSFESIERTNFLQLICKEDDEVIFTNLLYYYLNSNPYVLNLFVADCLGVDKDNYKISREVKCQIPSDEERKREEKTKNDVRTGRVDLWIEGQSNIIVIENKIKSGINGIRHNLDSEYVLSQLDLYKEFAESVAYDNRKKVSCFILVPDYNEIDIKKFKAKEHYDTLWYSQLYNFFNRYDIKSQFKDDKYQLYEQFINAMSKHIYTADKEMERRFVFAINKGKP